MHPREQKELAFLLMPGFVYSAWYLAHFVLLGDLLCARVCAVGFQRTVHPLPRMSTFSEKTHVNALRCRRVRF